LTVCQFLYQYFYSRYIIYYRINCRNRYNSENSYLKILNFLINLYTFSEISLTLSSAYFLIFHGSRDPRTYSLASYLGELLTIKFKSKNILIQQNCLNTNLAVFEPITLNSPKLPLVKVAALEFAELSLNESLVAFAQEAVQKGFRKIKVLPLFLAPGIHVQQDIPTEIALAIKKINNQVLIELSPYLGKYSGIIPLLAQQFSTLSTAGRVVIAHGSRSPQVAHYYQNLARQLKALIAYWSVAPSLTQQVEAQIAVGQKQIGILPYFLFPGKITEAIAQEVSVLQKQYPQVELILGQPLGATESLAELIVEEI
jgi:sirohydrochlorin cobaltochelatase